MGINSMNTKVVIPQANTMDTSVAEAKSQELAGQIQNEAVEGAEQGIGEGAGISEGEGVATLTEGAVKESSGNGSNGGGSQGQSDQKGGNEGSATGTQGTGNTKGVVKSASAQEVAKTVLANTKATESDIDGVTARISAPVQDFSRPMLPEPATKLTTAGLLMQMIKVQSETTNISIENQSNNMKANSSEKLQLLKEKAEKMQKHYESVRSSKVNPFVRFFQNLGKLITATFNGDKAGMQEAKEGVKKAWNDGKSQFIAAISVVLSAVIGGLMIAATGGGAGPIVALTMALIVGAVFSDPKVLGSMAEACEKAEGKKDGPLSKFVKALCKIIVVAATITQVVASGGGKAIAGLGKGIAKKVFSQLLGKESAGKFSAEMAKVGKDITNKTLANVSTGLEVVEGVSTGTATTVIDYESNTKRVEGMKAKAEADMIGIQLENDNIDRDKNNAMTEQIMEQYRNMIETLFQAIHTTNAATANAARA